LSAVWSGVASSSYGPTPMHREQLEIAMEEMNELKPNLEDLKTKLKKVELELIEAGAPVVID
jgi:hypothetical protein